MSPDRLPSMMRPMSRQDLIKPLQLLHYRISLLCCMSRQEYNRRLITYCIWAGIKALIYAQSISIETFADVYVTYVTLLLHVSRYHNAQSFFEIKLSMFSFFILL